MYDKNQDSSYLICKDHARLSAENAVLREQIARMQKALEAIYSTTLPGSPEDIVAGRILGEFKKAPSQEVSRSTSYTSE